MANKENHENLTKAELVKLIEDKVGSPDISEKDVYKVLDAYTDVILEAVKDGKKVVIPGLVSIDSKTMPEGVFRNPATGEKITKPERRAPKVTPLKNFKDILSQ